MGGHNQRGGSAPDEGLTATGTRVILFGSHTRGEAGRHSDLDFLVGGLMASQHDLADSDRGCDTNLVRDPRYAAPPRARQSNRPTRPRVWDLRTRSSQPGARGQSHLRRPSGKGDWLQLYQEVYAPHNGALKNRTGGTLEQYEIESARRRPPGATALHRVTIS
jgi:Nucleotidyltransferase domain